MVRTAWLVAGSILAAAALVSGTFNIVELLAHEMETRVVTVDANGITRIDVDSDAGSVTIEAADVDEITVRARIGHGLRRSGSAVSRDGDRLVVRGSCPVFGSQWCDVRYTIQVPARIDVVVRSDNDGVRVTGVEGDVEAHSDNGTIRVADVVGNLDLSSDNGRIEAERVTADVVRAGADNGRITLVLASPPRTVEATSDNGRIELLVPDGGEVYAVDISTDNGRAESTLRTDPESARTVVLRSDNGTVTAHYAA